MHFHEITVPATDGYRVPLEVSEAAEPSARLLLLPALGIQARLYRRLGAQLAASGISMTALEQRGHGRSAPRPSRNCDYGCIHLSRRCRSSSPDTASVATSR